MTWHFDIQKSYQVNNMTKDLIPRMDFDSGWWFQLISINWAVGGRNQLITTNWSHELTEDVSSTLKPQSMDGIIFLKPNAGM